MDVIGVTTVAGNQTLGKTTLNARRILSAAGRKDVPVAPGMDRPLLVPLVTAGNIDGESGLDGYAFETLSECDQVIGAQEFLEQTFEASSDPVPWIATGPLTNVAAFLLGHPHLRAKIASISVMGGSLGRGNITDAAEFNIYVDPDAAQHVFQSGLPIRMVGLDVTHLALLQPQDRQRFLTLKAPIGEMLHALFGFYGHQEVIHTGLGGIAIHDVLAVAALVEPGLFRWRTTPMTVSRSQGASRGATRPGGSAPAVEVAVDIDVEKFFSWLWSCLDTYR
jgi:inosine-uridine nucleoside N-ribohydrolase